MVRRVVVDCSYIIIKLQHENRLLKHRCNKLVKLQQKFVGDEFQGVTQHPEHTSLTAVYRSLTFFVKPSGVWQIVTSCDDVVQYSQSCGGTVASLSGGVMPFWGALKFCKGNQRVKLG